MAAKRKCEWCGKNLGSKFFYNNVKGKKRGQFCCARCAKLARESGWKGSKQGGCCGCLVLGFILVGTALSAGTAYALAALVP